MSQKFLFAILLMVLGHIVSWYVTYSVFIWKWAKDNINLLPLIFSIPTGYLWVYGMKYAIEEMGETWGPRLIGFGLSHLVFPALVYFYFNESFLHPKTLVCIALSFLIVLIQVLWK